jgi:hypothetical protein
VTHLLDAALARAKNPLAFVILRSTQLKINPQHPTWLSTFSPTSLTNDFVSFE